jgi:hypothetical protein
VAYQPKLRVTAVSLRRCFVAACLFGADINDAVVYAARIGQLEVVHIHYGSLVVCVRRSLQYSVGLHRPTRLRCFLLTSFQNNVSDSPREPAFDCVAGAWFHGQRWQPRQEQL